MHSIGVDCYLIAEQGHSIKSQVLDGHGKQSHCHLFAGSQ